MKREDIGQSQQGTGSAEHTGQDREAQSNQMTNLDKEQKKNIAEEGGLGRKRIADLNDTGALSGRDDYAGAPDDDMGSQHTGEPTDR